MHYCNENLKGKICVNVTFSILLLVIKCLILICNMFTYICILIDFFGGKCELFLKNVTHFSVSPNKPPLRYSEVIMHKDDVTSHAEFVCVSVIERDSVSVCVCL